MENAPTLYVVAGPNGAGKSTLSNQLLHGSIEFLNPDIFSKEMKAKGLFDLESWKEFIKEIDNRISDQKTFAIETTLSGKTSLERIQRAKDNGYKIDFTFISLASKEMHYERVASRAMYGGHGVPLDIISSRFDDAYKNLPQAIGLSDNAVIFNNSGDRRVKVMSIKKGIIENINLDAVTKPLKNAFPDKALEVGSNLSEGLESSIKMTL